MSKGGLIRLGVFATSLLALAFLAMTYKVAQGQDTVDISRYSREAQQGSQITPVKVNLSGKDPNLVYIGSYLVNGQGGCNGCHTCPAYSSVNPYAVGGTGLPSGPSPGATSPGALIGLLLPDRRSQAGQPSPIAAPSGHTPINTNYFLGGGTPFPDGGKSFQGGRLSSPNITPNSAGLPGGLSYADFKSAMQSGIVSNKPGHVLQVMPWPTYRNLYESDLQAIYQYLSAIPSAQSGTCSAANQTGN